MFVKNSWQLPTTVIDQLSRCDIPYLFGYEPILAISRDPKVLPQKINLIITNIIVNAQYSVLSQEPFSILKFIIDHEIFVKIQSNSDCKIALKAIKWMQKIRNTQAT